MTSGKALTVAFLAALAVFIAVHFLDFPGSVPDFVRASGGGVLLDVKPAFTEAAIYERMTGYGERGRQNYAFRNVTADVLLPLGLLPFLILLMMRALRTTSWAPAVRAILISVPVAYVVFDLVENAAVLAMLRNYPERLHLMSAALPYITVIKRIASLLAILVPFVILSLVFVRKRYRARIV